jgi:uncharacterized membrane protein YhhN
MTQYGVILIYSFRPYSFIPFILFLGFAVINVNANRIHNTRQAHIAKPFLMPLLLATYLMILPDQSLTWSQQWPVIMALLCHTVGDILLMAGHKDTPVCLGAGMLSFFMGHIFYILWFFRKGLVKNPYGLVSGTLVMIFLLIWLYGSLAKGDRKLAKMIFPYCFGLAFLAVVIAGTYSFSFFAESQLCLIGISLFCFSDSLIGHELVGRRLFGNTTVMWTYILAQFMLVSGIAAFQIA